MDNLVVNYSYAKQCINKNIYSQCNLLITPFSKDILYRLKNKLKIPGYGQYTI